jgi:hypothetical protein
MTLQPSSSQMPFTRRQLGLQFLDLTDCVSLEDSGLKMIVETCPQLMYLFLRRCVNVTGKCCSNQKRVVVLRALSVSHPPDYKSKVETRCTYRSRSRRRHYQG